MNGSDQNKVVPLRLQKFLARAGVASRRGSENLMTAGRVTVNGKVVTELGSRIDPLVDEVAVDGMVVSYPNDAVTIMLNKPAGYITTMSDPYGRPCVAHLVPIDIYPGLFPVGRLDTETTGLLLFTTDGELGNRLTHPKYHVSKTYEACIEGVLKDAELNPLRKGIVLEDGPTRPAEAELLRIGKGSSEVRIVLHEGRKRQVRRMFEAIEHPVQSLKRLSVGNLDLGKLEEGSWRMLNESELTKLF